MLMIANKPPPTSLSPPQPPVTLSARMVVHALPGTSVLAHPSGEGCRVKCHSVIQSVRTMANVWCGDLECTSVHAAITGLGSTVTPVS